MQVCGITNAADAAYAVEQGADLIGELLLLVLLLWLLCGGGGVTVFRPGVLRLLTASHSTARNWHASSMLHTPEHLA